MAKRPHITDATRRNIMDAFWKLYQTKSIEQMTVREITELAGYNRGTFYLYFKDIHDVLISIENEVLDVAKCEIDKYRIFFKENEHKPTVAEITDVAIKISEICDYKLFKLLDDGVSSRFEEIIKKKICDYIKSQMSQPIQMDVTANEYFIYFIASGVVGIFKKWYKDGMNIPIEKHIEAICGVLYGESGSISSVYKIVNEES